MRLTKAFKKLLALQGSPILFKNSDKKTPFIKIINRERYVYGILSKVHYRRWGDERFHFEIEYGSSLFGSTMTYIDTDDPRELYNNIIPLDHSDFYESISHQFDDIMQILNHNKYMIFNEDVCEITRWECVGCGDWWNNKLRLYIHTIDSPGTIIDFFNSSLFTGSVKFIDQEIFEKHVKDYIT